MLLLEKMASLTPYEIKKKQPVLFKKLSEKVSINLKANAETRLKKAPKYIRDMLVKIDLKSIKVGTDDIKFILAKSLITTKTLKKRKQEIETDLAKIPELGKIDDLLRPDVPVLVNPVFQRDLMKAKLYHLSDIAGLSQLKAEKVIEKELRLNTQSDEKLGELVKGKILTVKEAKDLGLAVNLYTLFDSNYKLTEFVSKGNIPKMNGKASSLENFIALDKSDWEKLVTNAKIELPKEIKPKEYAEILYKKVEVLFPNETLVFRVLKREAKSITNALSNLKPLFDQNKEVFGITAFEDLKTDNLNSNEIKKLKSHYQNINRIIRVHPGLKIHEILNDNNLSVATKGKGVVERIGLLDKFFKNNPDVDYLFISYTHDSQDIKALNFTGFNSDEKAMVLNSIKSYQRVYSFTNDIEHTEAILAAGFHSAYHITSVTLDDFATVTKLDSKIAAKYFENAHDSIIRTTGVIGSVLDILSGSFDWTKVGNTSPTIKDYLKDIPGYQDLFGDLAFCDCQWCQSIHSPAAYFVDLMQFVEKYVLKKHFSGSKASHVLNLKIRRPDLWTLPVTCENTNTLVPYLDIINEILESFIAKKVGFSGDLNDRAAVEDFVYKKEIALEKPNNWKDSVFSFLQPFHLPIESLSTYLHHFERAREEVAKLLKRPKAVISNVKLNLSEKEFQLITTPDNAPAFIKRIYGISFSVQSGIIEPFDAQLLLKPMGLTRKELGRLINTRFVTNNYADNIVIQGEKIDSNSIQNDIERIKNLTFNTLDRAHRFTRLWRKTSWTIEELDLILTQLDTMGISSGISAASVSEIGHLISIQEKLKISVEELCALWGTMPTLSVKERQKSLLDSLFNHDDVVTIDGAYPKAMTVFIHPALIIDHSTASAEFSTGRLMAGLNRSDAEVLTLIKYLAQPLSITNINSAIESERGFNITLQNLTLLYRHSKIADILKVSINELFQLINLIESAGNGYIEDIEHLNSILEFHKWWKKTDFSLDELHFIIKSSQIVNPENFILKEDVTQYVLNQTKTENALLFADTVFAYFDDITEEQSKLIFSANTTIIELSPDGSNYWLKPAFNPVTPITVPAGITRAETELRVVLTDYHPQTLIPHFISGQLGLNKEQIFLLIRALGSDLDDDAYTLELQEQTTPAVAIPQLIEKLIPLSILFRDKKFDNNVLNYVLNHLSIFEITSIDSISVDNIQKLYLFKQFLTKQDEDYNIDLLSDVLGAFVVATQFRNADQNKLATLLNSESGLLATIHPVAGDSSNALESLGELVKLVEIASYLGIGGDILPLIVSNLYDDLQQASMAILAAFRTKYKSEEERKEKLEAYQDKLRSSKRASLTTYLIHSGFPQFESENELFHYFLIDTELEGCARTSRLVAATMSLQLYIHRILLNLEQDDKEPGTAGKIHVRADDIPGDEWTWRKNYSVWEANRKVFLYPENYIEPELRDNKTPLFEELESELLQLEINEDTVLDAYAKYMRGFDEVTHLKIAGSYHEKDEDTKTDVLHLLGVTADEPPIYYYRTVENIYFSEKEKNRGVVWNPWTKINVQIPVRKVAPVLFNGRLHVFWVKVTTLANTVFDKNQSIFTGYNHKLSIEFTTLKLDGAWTPPQKLSLYDNYAFSGNGIIQDPLADQIEKVAYMEELHDILRSFPFFNFSSLNDEREALKTPRYDTKIHNEPIDEYTLNGFMWDQVFPSVVNSKLHLTGAGYQMRSAIDFYNLSTQITGFHDNRGRDVWTLNINTPGKILWFQNNNLYRGSSPTAVFFDNYAYGSLLVNASKTDELIQRHWDPNRLNVNFDNVRQEQIAKLSLGTSIGIVNGAYSDAIIDAQGDILLVQGSPVEGDGFLLKRLGTTLSETITRTLFTSGVETMLDIETQKKLEEAPAPITITNNRIINKVIREKIDYKGAYGTYYREIFFHIPFLLANHLNSQGKYSEAQKWYHYIFNPSATEVIDISDPSLTPAQKKKLELDRNWQYLEFREIDTKSLRDQLQDKQAIEVYKKDPFNPHAIARLRLNAYQKSIVMKYVDNLLDWGDYLFTQDTMESINEATLLYVIAKEILGDRPAELGNCGEGKIQPKTFEEIGPLLNQGSEFLAELEHYTFVGNTYPKKQKGIYSIDSDLMHGASKKVAIDVKASKGLNYETIAAGSWSAEEINVAKEFESSYLPEIKIKPIDDARTSKFAKGTIRGLDWKKDSIYTKDFFKLPSFGISILSHVSPVFCVPGNKELLQYWDRVDDRLFKIRNCMNILGERRQLSLFAPEIDPMLLVRAKAAGLSLDDILNSLSGNLPPYRFSYIIEKAKAYTSLVQSFGASLLNALEKKDGEELAQLRMLHLQNILEMTSKSRKMEIDSANEGIKTIGDRIESLTYQLNYYEDLISQNLNSWETLQQISRHTATFIHGIELPLGWMSGTLHLIPQVGSPFAMKYGGAELGKSAGAFFKGMATLATISDSIASSAGLEAGFERRKQGWKHQKKLLNYELKQTEKNLVAAEIRRDILIESEKIHQKNIEHNNEVMEFYGDKFSNLGLYTWLSSTMQRLYKEAYNNANSIANLAEQTYRFEKDDSTNFIEGNYFESPRAGLLAGERLLMGLQAMERRYLETNYRKSEIDQAFSVTQLDPAALLLLKQTGTCEFNIPEVFFDLFYPGQYRRKIKAVRLTIPSVTGPYTNVSANLSLVKSDIRMEAKLGNTELKEVPKSRTTNIATSTAVNDAGVFQLNFGDARYMPFEGAGAISSWKLTLPKNFRQFDYSTINDVIINISYTAEYDELFRDKVEEQNDAIEGTLINILKNNSLSRTLSFRQEFSNDFHRLTQQAVNQPIAIKIENKHFPLFMNGRSLKITKAKFILVTPEEQTVNNVDIIINGASQSGFTKDSTLGDLYSKDLGNLFNGGILKDHSIAVSSGGDLAPTAPAPDNVAAIDMEKLEDIILYVEYTIG